MRRRCFPLALSLCFSCTAIFSAFSQKLLLDRLHRPTGPLFHRDRPGIVIRPFTVFYCPRADAFPISDFPFFAPLDRHVVQASLLGILGGGRKILRQTSARGWVCAPISLLVGKRFFSATSPFQPQIWHLFPEFPIYAAALPRSASGSEPSALLLCEFFFFF